LGKVTDDRVQRRVLRAERDQLVGDAGGIGLLDFELGVEVDLLFVAVLLR
jgi:hypothetical protein